MAILVTGGAGYIGSVTVDLLRTGGEQVVVLDSEVPLYEGKVGDRALVRRLLGEQQIDAVIHFAGLISVAESGADPRVAPAAPVQPVRLVQGHGRAGPVRLRPAVRGALVQPRGVPVIRRCAGGGTPRQGDRNAARRLPACWLPQKTAPATATWG